MLVMGTGTRAIVHLPARSELPEAICRVDICVVDVASVLGVVDEAEVVASRLALRSY